MEEVISKHPCDIVDTIFGNNGEYIDYEDWKELDFGRSLLLLEVSDLEIGDNDRGKTKASFVYEGRQYYNYSVTDFEYMHKKVSIDKAHLVVSIGTKFKPYSSEKELNYKWVAAIYPC